MTVNRWVVLVFALKQLRWCFASFMPLIPKTTAHLKLKLFIRLKRKKARRLGRYKVLIGKFEKDTSGADETDPDADETAELELVEKQTEGGEDVVEAQAAKSQINVKFNNSSTTPLEVDIEAGENNLTIELQDKAGTGTVK